MFLIGVLKHASDIPRQDPETWLGSGGPSWLRELLSGLKARVDQSSLRGLRGLWTPEARRDGLGR